MLESVHFAKCAKHYNHFGKQLSRSPSFSFTVVKLDMTRLTILDNRAVFPLSF